MRNLGLAVALLAGATIAFACNNPDPGALATQPDAAYVETVTTASAGATALPPTNAPGGQMDASAPLAADAAAAASGVDLSAVANGLHPAVAPTKPAASASSAPAGFSQGCAGPAAVAPALGVAPGAAPAASAAPAACGDKPLPACPMTAWMKSNAGPAAANADSDLPTLASVLDKISTFAPPGYPNWVSISKDGANAARAGQLDAARASCRSCHTQYKAKYKAEIRSRPLP